jgi:uncharacterized membrane protein YhaH (DUF805 family)
MKKATPGLLLIGIGLYLIFANYSNIGFISHVGSIIEEIRTKANNLFALGLELFIVGLAIVASKLNERTTKILFSFEGRISRKTYWKLFLVLNVGIIITTIIDFATTGQQIGITQLLFILMILWPSLAIHVKRWHDRDKSGLWVLINIIPFLGPIWALVENGFLPGTEGGNRYGENPMQKI